MPKPALRRVLPQFKNVDRMLWTCQYHHWYLPVPSMMVTLTPHYHTGKANMEKPIGEIRAWNI